MTSGIISSHPDILGGALVFRGTRVPVEAVFENLADGLSLDEVLEAFPTLNREDVVALLKEVPASLAVGEAA